MRILVEQSGYPLANLGDISMLQVAVARLENLWSNALIEVLTYSPDRLVKFCPNTRPLSPVGRRIWFYPLIGRFYQLMPNSIAQHWSELEWNLRNRLPFLVRVLMQLKIKARPIETTAFKFFVESVYKADLVVASGGGYITDEFEEFATTVFGVLGVAKKLGKPVVMLGQGFGPLEKPELRTKAKSVLPSIDLIALREGRASIPLLNSLGVSQKQVLVTGDDAIELAYEARSPKLGNGIGVNLRLANYADVSIEIVEIVRAALQEVAKKKGIPLIPVPISEYDADAETIQQLLAGYQEGSDGGQSLDTPLKVIKQIGRCRIVVTGSYHAGVFALAQGIPVVSLANSKYYIDKFSGLASQFGIGCEFILLDDNQLREKLYTSIENAWNSKEEVRGQLLESARRQIKLGYAAYRRVYELVDK